MIGGITIDEKGQTRVLIHYAYRIPTAVPGTSRIAVACMMRGGAKAHCSGEKSAVTCPLCKLTEAYKA